METSTLETTRIPDWQVLTEYPSVELAAEWFEFLSESDYPTFYTSPAYFIAPYWKGKNPFAILIRDKGRIVAVACGTFVDQEICVGLPVRPQVAIRNGAGDVDIAEGLRQALESVGEGKSKLITVYSMHPIPGMAQTEFRETTSIAGDRVVMLDLTDGKEATMMGFSSSRRANIRKAIRRNEVEVSEIADETELKILHGIHENWCGMKGIEPDSWDVFRDGKQIKDFVKTFIAKKDGEIIAGSYYRLVADGIFEYSGNNSLPEDRGVRPNDLLMWKAIEWACDNGFKKFCMGASHPFLQRFGGTIEASYRYRLDQTLMRRYDSTEAISKAVLSMYRAIPEPARDKVKQMLGR